jgi:subtilisin family serine protease
VRQVLRDSVAAGTTDEVARIRGEVVDGAVLRLRPGQAARLADEPGVAAVEPNLTFTARTAGAPGSVEAPDARGSAEGAEPAAVAAAGSSGASDEVVPISGQRVALSWGLDRTDDVIGLDGDYSPATNGAGVHAYVLDGNVVATHPEFAGRVGTGATFVNDTTGTAGCDGHGTHVAGIIGSNLLGMATEVTLHPVRVMDCSNSGTSLSLLNGINWVIADWEGRGSPPAVVNMSLGGPPSAVVAAAVATMSTRGMVVVASAGNAEPGSAPVDACSGSPANIGPILTVGAVDITDTEASFSNWGTCLDLYAPGEDILSTNWSGAPGTAVQASGTSQAAPHVSGAVAVYWSQFPQAKGPQVQRAIVDQSGRGLITFLRPGVGSPNLLLNAAATAAPPPPGAPAPTLRPVPVELPPPVVDPPRAIPDDGGQVLLRPPDRVKGLRVVKATRTRVTVRFRPAAFAKTYTLWSQQVNRAAKKGSVSWRRAGTTPKTRFTVKRLRPGTRYRIRVVAKNGDGASPRAFVRARTKL